MIETANGKVEEGYVFPLPLALAILNYLAQQPYHEVNALIKEMQELLPVEERE